MKTYVECMEAVSTHSEPQYYREMNSHPHVRSCQFTVQAHPLDMKPRGPTANLYLLIKVSIPDTRTNSAQFNFEWLHTSVKTATLKLDASNPAKSRTPARNRPKVLINTYGISNKNVDITSRFVWTRQKSKKICSFYVLLMFVFQVITLCELVRAQAPVGINVSEQYTASIFRPVCCVQCEYRISIRVVSIKNQFSIQVTWQSPTQLPCSFTR
jgi:hypothetical protein